jgi:hypothetical protein
MPVLVSDTSVVIDLDRGGLLDAVFGLPQDFAVPDLLFRRELAGELGDRLVQLGLRIEDLTADELAEATRITRVELALSGPDAFAYALARARNWTLLGGDGALWVVDQLEAEAVLPVQDLHDGLGAIAAHPRCRLPRGEITRRLNRYRQGG